jgi:hypothetical protein
LPSGPVVVMASWYHCGHGWPRTGWGVGVAVAVGLDVGVGLGRSVGVAVAVGVGVRGRLPLSPPTTGRRMRVPDPAACAPGTSEKAVSNNVKPKSTRLTTRRSPLRDSLMYPIIRV